MRTNRISTLLFLTFCAFLLLTKCTAGEEDLKSFGNYLNSTLSIADGILHNFGNVLPTPKEIIEAPIQLLVGLPSQLVSDAIDEVCSFSLQADSVKPKYTPSNDNLEMLLLIPCHIFFYKLTNAEKLVNNTNFDRNKKVVIFCSGWNADPNNTEIVRVISKAYHCRGDVNFLAINAARVITTLYTWSAFNTDRVGYFVAQFLVQLVKFVPLENIHLMGHSLGAHIMSFAAIYFKIQTGQDIPYITGLDPARPCFNEGEVLAGLSHGDAKFVDVIHSNPGVLGKREPMGDVDFYVNGLDAFCSHLRSWYIYAESVYPGNEKNFLATRCSSLHKLEHARCPGEQHAMGYAIDKELKGNFFAETGSTPPYGKGGTKEREKANENCGVCQDKTKMKISKEYD